MLSSDSTNSDSHVEINTDTHIELTTRPDEEEEEYSIPELSQEQMAQQRIAVTTKTSIKSSEWVVNRFNEFLTRNKITINS